jgi:hypothetical protein
MELAGYLNSDVDAGGESGRSIEMCPLPGHAECISDRPRVRGLLG